MPKKVKHLTDCWHSIVYETYLVMLRDIMRGFEQMEQLQTSTEEVGVNQLLNWSCKLNCQVTLSLFFTFSLSCFFYFTWREHTSSNQGYIILKHSYGASVFVVLNVLAVPNIHDQQKRNVCGTQWNYVIFTFRKNTVPMWQTCCGIPS